ncbi:DUF3347 domain-containing protein [Paraflavitalea speifideaquila]|uniref:DUF3347 domain-containing protein n=1 Tax=Paraflavitalea speifideaquila TaxID=3076558 RepID=UPI0028EE3B0E|nr:DUF3347 domain-containing protein [Paraflavitalea speifideiaquila]
MKRILVSTFTIGTLFLAACGNNEAGSAHEGHEAKKDSAAPAAAAVPENLTTITPTFTQVDPAISASLQEVWQHYFHIEFALTNDDANEAGNGGVALVDAMARVNKAAMPADQKALYEKNEEDLREHAEHIGKSTGAIKHQREHFEKMSKDVYELIIGFGAGKPVYKTFCPMAFDNKGAYWISTAAAVKNPYFGKEMLTCGEVQEAIK